MVPKVVEAGGVGNGVKNYYSQNQRNVIHSNRLKVCLLSSYCLGYVSPEQSSCKHPKGFAA